MQPYQGKHAPRKMPAYTPTPVTASRGHFRHARINRKRRLLIALVVFLVLLPLLICILEPGMLTVDRVTLRSEDLPSDVGHLRIAYVSDIHYGFFFNDGRVEDLVSRINSLNPDLVLFGGDYGADNLSAVSFFNKLAGHTVHARYKVMGVVGDTDLGESAFELNLLKDAMKNAGVIPLVNTVEPVRIGNSTVYVAGVDDPVAGTPALSSVASSVKGKDFVIFLAHNPQIISAAQSATDADGRLNWFDLALFGHTHGGQMKLFGSFLGLTEDIPDRYHGGWLTENRVNILVSNGVGTEFLPFRFFTPPQIHQIDISSN